MSSDDQKKATVTYENGWHYTTASANVGCFSSYPATLRAIEAAGLVHDNAGWRHYLLLWNWTHHSCDKFPEWEIGLHCVPHYAETRHHKGKGEKSVDQKLKEEWDDVAQVGFYMRPFTESGIQVVYEGEDYRLGWWFATMAERDRFLAWYKEKYE